MSEWDRCAGWIAAALAEAPETHSLDDVRQMIAAGEAWFFPFDRSACVCLVFDEPRAKTCHQWLVGGDLNDLLSHREEVEAWAKSQGCTRMLTAGRKGWSRVMAPFGYGFAAEVLHKEL